MLDDIFKIIVYVLIAWFIVSKLFPSKESYQTVGTGTGTGYNSLVLADSSGNMNSIAFPKGMIMAYYGSIGTIPSGWALCDGTNGTPDLRGRFILGVNPNSNKNTLLTAREINSTGGSETHTLTISEMPSHRHSAPYFNGNNSCECGGGSCACKVEKEKDTGTTGESQAHNNMPPFFTLAYLMKL